MVKEKGGHMMIFMVWPDDAVKKIVYIYILINTWSLRHLTSAEEYPDEEYLDMSKSSSLKDRR